MAFIGKEKLIIKEIAPKNPTIPFEIFALFFNKTIPMNAIIIINGTKS